MIAYDTPDTETGKTRRKAGQTEHAQPCAVPGADRPASKQDRLRGLLAQDGGASLDALQHALGWQPHTVRAAISGLRKAGLEVLRETGADGTTYRLTGVQGA